MLSRTCASPVVLDPPAADPAPDPAADPALDPAADPSLDPAADPTPDPELVGRPPNTENCRCNAGRSSPRMLPARLPVPLPPDGLLSSYLVSERGELGGGSLGWAPELNLRGPLSRDPKLDCETARC